MPHRIRLRHPWEQQILTGDPSAAEPPKKVQSSCSRRFNRPTGLNEDDSIELEVNVDRGEVDTITLNSQVLWRRSHDQPPLARDGIRVELNEFLLDHNQLEIHLSMIDDEPQLGDVNLWINTD